VIELEFRTTKCSAAQHREFTVRFGAPCPVPNLERMLLGYFEEAVAAGTRFKAGETVQLGWAVLRLIDRPDGTLGVLEPDLRGSLKWVESVDQSLFETWRQQEVLRSLGLDEYFSPPRQAQRAVVCTRVWESPGLLMGRAKSTEALDSGWFVGCTDEGHDHEAAESLQAVPLIELAARSPALAQFFALPVGSDVAVRGPGRIKARIFFQEQELTPKPGSYLHAVLAPEAP
jgi:hypothetical protein